RGVRSTLLASRSREVHGRRAGKRGTYLPPLQKARRSSPDAVRSSRNGSESARPENCPLQHGARGPVPIAINAGGLPAMDAVESPEIRQGVSGDTVSAYAARRKPEIWLVLRHSVAGGPRTQPFRTYVPTPAQQEKALDLLRKMVPCYRRHARV